MRHDDLRAILRRDRSIVHGHGVTTRVGREGCRGGGSETVIVLHIVGTVFAYGAAAFVAHGTAYSLSIVALLPMMMAAVGRSAVMRLVGLVVRAMLVVLAGGVVR